LSAFAPFFLLAHDILQVSHSPFSVKSARRKAGLSERNQTVEAYRLNAIASAAAQKALPKSLLKWEAEPK
jgi:hypothetical protein